MLKNETTMFNVSVKFLGGCAMEWRNGGGGEGRAAAPGRRSKKGPKMRLLVTLAFVPI